MEGLLGEILSSPYFILTVVLAVLLVLVANKEIIKTWIDKGLELALGKQFALKRKAKKYLKENDYYNAGKILEEAGEYEEALKLYEQAELYQAAGELLERINRHREAIEFYIKQGNYQRAADIYINEFHDVEKAAGVLKESGRYHEAAELYIKNKRWLEAAQLMEKIGFHFKAAQLYEKAGKIDKAAECYEKWFLENRDLSLGQMNESEKIALKKAITYYRQLGEYEKAFNLARSENLFSVAAELAERLGRWEEAARLHEQAHNYERAARIYEKIGNNHRAYLMKAEHYLFKGDQVEAAHWYEKAGDFEKAAELFEWNNEFEKAARCYERARRFGPAGECLLRVGKKRAAAICFEKAGDYQKAAYLYKELKEYNKALQLYEKAGLWYEAGRIASLMGLEDKAIELLQKVEPEDEEAYRKASSILGSLFLDRKEYDLAEERLKAALAGAPPSKSNIDIYYKLAQIAEAKGDHKKAFELYKTITSIDLHFQDAKERMAALSKTVEQLRKLEFMTNDPDQRYAILEKVGEGGMGIVYKAEDRLLKRIVALKILNPELTRNRRAVERFLQEARSAAQLSHPNIVIVYDVGNMGRHYFITMEYIEGITLLRYLKEHKRLGIRQILYVASKLFSALDYAHQRGIIHRDIKPQNLMLSKDRKLKVMDFGLAIILSERRDGETTGGIIGTPYYMSPEQCLGDRVDWRTDIYSAGATLYHLLVGLPPFRGDNVIKQHIHAKPVPPSKLRRDVPPELDAFIMKCLEKKRENRFQSAREALNYITMISKKYLKT